MSRQIGRSAPEDYWNLNTAAHGDVEEPPARDPLDRQLITRAGVNSGAGGHALSRKRCLRSRAAEHEDRVALEALVQREAARRLAKLGGTEPGLEYIPRRRMEPE